MNRRKLRQQLGLMLFRISHYRRAGLRNYLSLGVSFKIFNMHICTDIRAEGAVVYLMSAVVLKPLKHMTPLSVHSRLYGGSNNKRYRMRFKQSHDLLKIVVIITRSVLTGSYAFAALNAFLSIDLNNVSVVVICGGNWAVSYARVTAYAFIFCNMDHIFSPFGKYSNKDFKSLQIYIVNNTIYLLFCQ